MVSRILDVNYVGYSEGSADDINLLLPIEANPKKVVDAEVTIPRPDGLNSFIRMDRLDNTFKLVLHDAEEERSIPIGEITVDKKSAGQWGTMFNALAAQLKTFED